MWNIGRTSIKKIINLYIIAAQNNKDCVCFLYKQEPENIKSQLPVFITDEHGLKEIKVLLCTNTMGSSSHNRTLSCNAVTKGFSRPTSHPVQGWMGNNKAFCSHRTRDGRRVIKVYSTGPFTLINNDKNAPCAKGVNSVSLLESRLSEPGRIPVMETVFSVQTHSSCITSLSIICIYALLEFSLFCITLSCI